MGLVSCLRRMNSTELMLVGIYHHNENLKNRIALPELVARLEGIHSSIYELNLCREVLKARLEEKTDEIERQITELEKLYQEIKKVIQQEVPKELWTDFGIEETK